MPHVKISYPHKGADGKERKVGQVVELDQDEARNLVRDGWAVPAEAPKAKPAVKAPVKAEKPVEPVEKPAE